MEKVGRHEVVEGGRAQTDMARAPGALCNGEKAWEGGLGLHYERHRKSLYFMQNSRRSLSRGVT